MWQNVRKSFPCQYMRLMKIVKKCFDNMRTLAY